MLLNREAWRAAVCGVTKGLDDLVTEQQQQCARNWITEGKERGEQGRKRI